MRHHLTVTSPPIDAPDSSPPAVRPSWRTRLAALRRPIVVIAGIGTVLGGLAGYVTMFRTVKTSLPDLVDAAAPALAQPLSIAVLPLANQTGDPAKAYLADGLTTAITADLARLSDVLVAPPLAAAGLQRRDLTLAQLGQEAHVRFVLQGAVTASGERLRIAATLSDTRSARQLWAQTFEGQASDLFTLQDSVTLRIRATVGPTMVLAAVPEAQRRSHNPQAADFVLRAQALGLQPRTLANQQKLVELWKQALAIEPTHRVAMEGYAYATANLVSSFSVSLKLDSAAQLRRLEEVEPMARQVLIENPASGEMAAVLSDIAFHRRDVDGARRVLLEAYDRDPRSWLVHNELTYLHTRIGEPEAAYEWGQKALRLPTFRPPAQIFSHLREACMMMGRYDEAAHWARRTVEINPERPLTHARLAVALAMSGDEAGAHAATAEALQRDPKFVWVIDVRAWPGKEEAYRHYRDDVLRVAVARAGLPSRERMQD